MLSKKLITLSAIFIISIITNAQTITGKIIDHEGNGLANVQLTLYSLPYTYTTTSETDGSFSFTNITNLEEENELPTGYQISSNYPNPFNPSTRINILLPEPNNIKLQVYNIIGQEVIQPIVKNFNAGNNSLDIVLDGLPNGIYIAKITIGGKYSAIRKLMLLYGTQHLSKSNIQTSYNFQNTNLNKVTLSTRLDSIVATNQIIGKKKFINLPTMNGNSINIGSLIIDRFCPNIPTVLYAGKSYNTVQIGTQCWLKENLDVGTMIQASQDQSNIGTIEKYCYDDNPNNCATYGGLYQWAEAVQYKNGATNTSSPNPAFSDNVQGICPSGWHIPTLSEFETLSAAVNNSRDELLVEGQLSGTNISGFTALLAGYWSSTEGYSVYANFMYLSEYSGNVYLGFSGKNNGISVRCLKDEQTSGDGTGIIGTNGGKVTVTNSNSSIKGAFVDVPNGALNSNTSISISLASGIKAPNDDNAIVVKFEPDGLQFNKPVKIGLPYNSSVTDPTRLQAYYYDKDSLIVQEIPIDSIDTNNKLLIAKTDHFSPFYSGQHQVWADIQMVNVGGKVGAKVKLFGKNNLWQDVGFKYGIPVSLDVLLNTGIIYAGQAFDEYMRTDGLKLHSIFALTLKEVSLLIDPTKDSKAIYVKRDEVYNNIKNEKQILSMWNRGSASNTKILTTKWITDDATRQKFYSGEPLVFKFDNFNNPDPNKKYYVEVEWATALDPIGFYLSRLTPIYKFTNYSKSNLKKFSELSTNNSDVDNNGLDDAFQLLVADNNLAPNKPTTPNPSDNSTNQPTSLTLNWNCTDPNDDVLTYDLYFGKVNPPTQKVGSDLTTTSLSVPSLENNTPYFWYVVAKDDRGLSTNSDVWKFTTVSGGTTGVPCPGTPTVTDSRDGKVYNTVLIGNQCWLKENLNIGTRVNGSQNQTSGNGIEKYCYDDLESNCTTYGGLYQWNEAMAYSTTPGTKGICPDGWHIPTKTEFETLRSSTVVNSNSNTLKAVGQGSGSGAGTNSSGLSALLAGFSYNDGGFYYLGSNATFWSSTEYSSNYAYSMFLYYNNSNVTLYSNNKYLGFSVRCVKD